MVANAVDPSSLIGDRLLDVTVGWHVQGAERQAVRYFLRFENATELEVHTAGDGSLALVAVGMPADFDMENYGRFEFRALGAVGPLAAMVGKKIDGVDRILWQRNEVGLQLHAEGTVVVLANEADEIFLSDGDLPPDYDGASIE